MVGWLSFFFFFLFLKYFPARQYITVRSSDSKFSDTKKYYDLSYSWWLWTFKHIRFKPCKNKILGYGEEKYFSPSTVKCISLYQIFCFNDTLIFTHTKNPPLTSINFFPNTEDKWRGEKYILVLPWTQHAILNISNPHFVITSIV